MFRYHNVMFCCEHFRDMILLGVHGWHECNTHAVYMTWPEIEKFREKNK